MKEAMIGAGYRLTGGIGLVEMLKRDSISFVSSVHLELAEVVLRICRGDRQP